MSASLGRFPVERIVRSHPAERKARREAKCRALADVEKKRAALEDLACDQQMALWNIKALANMMDRVEEIHQQDFPDEIAAGIRMIQDMATEIGKKSSELL